MKKQALITGIDGFVGHYLAAELETHGYNVAGTTMGPAAASAYHVDVKNADQVLEVIRLVQPDVIFHLAGFTSVKASWSDPAEALLVNRDGTRHLYQALELLGLTPRVLVTSSAEVYGIPMHLPVTEDHPTKPNNPYAISKLAQEQVVAEFPEQQTTITRSFPHIGPGQTTTFVTADFAHQIVDVERGQSAAVHVGNLEAKRDFTDVRDVVVAYRLLLEQDTVGQIFNVCSGNSHRIKDILNQLCNCSTQSTIPIVQDPERMRPSDIPDLLGSHKKLTQVTGWRPKIILAETLKAIYQSAKTTPTI